jgi:hypothetical protein
MARPEAQKKGQKHSRARMDPHKPRKHVQRESASARSPSQTHLGAQDSQNLRENQPIVDTHRGQPGKQRDIAEMAPRGASEDESTLDGMSLSSEIEYMGEGDNGGSDVAENSDTELGERLT